MQLSEDGAEVKKSISLATNLEEPFENLLGRLEYVSDFYRAKRAIALCLHYVQKLKERISFEVPSNTAKSLQQGSPVLNTTQSITVETIKQAEVQIIKAVQTSHFQEELKALSTVQTLDNPKDKQSDPRKKYVLKSCSPLIHL